MNKPTLALIVLLAISSLIIAEIANAQTTPKPTVPEFSLKYLVTQFTIPPYSTINPYTGENQTLSPGYTGYRRSVEISVINQPYSPYINTDGDYIQLYYNVSLKGHYGDIWAHYPDSTYLNLFNASASAKTVIEVSLEPYPSIPDDSLLDFRLQAIIGHYNYETTLSGAKYVTGFTAFETSDWSNTQTVTLSGSSISAATPNPTSPTTSTPTITPTPTVTPTAPDTNGNFTNSITLPLDVLIIIIAVVVFLAVALSVLLFRRHRKTTKIKQSSFPTAKLPLSFSMQD